MSSSYNDHPFLASYDWEDFAGDLVHSPTLSPVLKTPSGGSSPQLDGCPSGASQPWSKSAPKSSLSPQTPADGSAQVDLGFPPKKCTSSGPEATGLDRQRDYIPPSQTCNITLEEFTQLANTAPVGSFLELMALDPKPSVPFHEDFSEKFDYNQSYTAIGEPSFYQQFPTTNQLSLLARQPLVSQASAQISHTPLHGIPSNPVQLPAHPTRSNSMACVCVALPDVYPDEGAIKEPVDNQVDAVPPDALSGLHVPARTQAEFIVNQPVDNSVIVQSNNTTSQLPLPSSASAAIHSTPSNSVAHDPIAHAQPSGCTARKLAVPVRRVLPEPPFLVLNQALLVTNQTQVHVPSLPVETSSRAQDSAPASASASSSSVSYPASYPHSKRKYNSRPDEPNPPSKRAKAPISYVPGKYASVSASPGSPNSENTDDAAGPSQTTTRGQSVTSTSDTNGRALEKTASFPIPDRLDLPEVPDRPWRESLVGTGSLYFTLSPDNKCRKERLPSSNPAMKLYACKYTCPVVGFACWRMKSKQNTEWLKAISSNKIKSFFPRHEAEWLRHLASHRWEEWALSRSKPLLGKTTWDHAKIDAQIVKDIEAPEAQPWCPSEMKNRPTKDKMIK